MKKGMIFLAAVSLLAATALFAEDHWVEGYAHNSNGTYHLTGWTIKCYSVTYGAGIVESTGHFQIMYDYRPTTPGYYHLTADSTGKSQLSSSSFYYSGSGQIDLGDVNFKLLVRDEQ